MVEHFKKNIRPRSQARAFVFALLFSASFSYSHFSHAQTPAPMPSPKPSFENAQASIIGKIGNFFSDTSSDVSSGQSEEDAPDKRLIEESEEDMSAEDAQASQERYNYKPSADIPDFIVALQNKPAETTLSNEDAQYYEKIFELQKAGDFQGADALIKKLNNPLILGHVLYQRYMHRSYVSRFSELQNWMAHYYDHPHAKKIYALAQRKGTGKLRKAHSQKGIARLREPTMRPASPYYSSRKRSQADINAVREIQSSVRALVRKGKNNAAINMVNSQRVLDLLDAHERDVLKAHIAAGLLYGGDSNAAYKLAYNASARSGEKAPQASWVCGLVTWMRGDYQSSIQYFELTASSSYASGWMVTAAAYWAARAHMRAGSVHKVSPLLEQGKTYPRTFYGMVSTRALGQDYDFNWKAPTFTRRYHEILSAIPAGARAIALAKAGQAVKAQAELLRQKPEDELQSQAFLAFASFADLPALSMRLASLLERPEGGYYDSALYPLVPWTPEGGWQLDTSLIHAVMKQESRFNPEAESYSGARGLMQLMPATARHVAGDLAERSDEPEINLQIGQSYLQELLSLQSVDNNLLYMLIAYNAGPGNLNKWKKRWPNVTDPLLFIELIPPAETREYIEKVLSNYWIYRLREGLDIPSLDSIAAGREAVYTGEQ